MFSLLQIIWSVMLILGGLSLQWPEAGSPFLARDGGWPAESAAARPALESPTTRPPEPVARPWPVSCVQMNFHIEMESGETSQVFTRRKKNSTHMWIDICVDIDVGGLRQLCACGSFNHWFEALLSFLWPIILICLVLSPYLAYQDPPTCACASHKQDGFRQNGLWVTWCHSPFDLQGAF